MIKMNYTQFMGLPFTQSIQKLTSQSFNARIAYAIKKIADKMHQQRNKIQAEYRELIEKFGTKDEKGELVLIGENKEGFDVPAERMEEYKAAEKAFGETQFTIDRPQLTLEEISKVEFTPAELGHLDPLIVDEPEACTGAIAPVLPISG